MKITIRRYSPHYEEWTYHTFNTLRAYSDWLLFELKEHEQHGEIYEVVE